MIEGISYRNEDRCASTYTLFTIIFFDPEESDTSKIIYICQRHYNFVFEELKRDYDQLSLKAKIKQSQLEKKIEWSRRNDVYVDIKSERGMIDQIYRRIKVIKRTTCRNSLCVADLNNVRARLYSCIVFGFKGTVKDTLYFCSRNCWNKIRVRCGIVSTPLERQRTLDQRF